MLPLLYVYSYLRGVLPCFHPILDHDSTSGFGHIILSREILRETRERDIFRKEVFLSVNREREKRERENNNFGNLYLP